jgi:hypothetical protein
MDSARRDRRGQRGDGRTLSPHPAKVGSPRRQEREKLGGGVDVATELVAWRRALFRRPLVEDREERGRTCRE